MANIPLVLEKMHSKVRAGNLINVPTCSTLPSPSTWVCSFNYPPNELQLACDLLGRQEIFWFQSFCVVNIQSNILPCCPGSPLFKTMFLQQFRDIKCKCALGYVRHASSDNGTALTCAVGNSLTCAVHYNSLTCAVKTLTRAVKSLTQAVKSVTCAAGITV